MDAALAEALAPVLRDLESSGSVVPDVRDDQWSGVDGQVTAMLYSADGSGQGVSAMITEPPAQRVASVADQVQEWVLEELCSIGRPAAWPECPQHPGSHPLSAGVRGSRPAWTCPGTGRIVSEIGRLPAPQ
jgi:hypothetical protein